MVKLAVCVSFKNEETILPITIPTWKAFSQEIIYLDTGSNDTSQEVALAAARLEDSVIESVSESRWADMSKANNQAMGAARSQWTLRLDADELLVGDPVRFQHWLTQVTDYCAEKKSSFPSILLSLMEFHEEKWKFINWRARLFVWEDGWRFQYPIDPQPVAPPDVPYGILCPPDILNVYHLRDSIRPGSLKRKECVIWERLLTGALSPEEIQHYENALTMCDMGEKGKA